MRIRAQAQITKAGVKSLEERILLLTLLPINKEYNLRSGNSYWI